jgi:phospholipid/cholesterol/gamma-HCH transport system substrate-binding protein
MDLHYRKETTVGALVILGFALFIGGTMWLKGSSLKRAKRTVTAEFADAAGLKPNNEVTVSGYSVGRVATVVFEGPGRIQVTANLTADVALHTDATAKVESAVFSNETKLILNPGSPTAPMLPHDQVIPGIVDAGLFGKGAALADRADSTLIGVQAIANERTANDLRVTLAALQRTLNILSERLPATTDEANKTLASLRHMTGRLDTLLSNPALDRATSRLDTLTSNLSGMTAQFTTTGARLDSLLTVILKGQGTLGKLATDSGLYYDTRATAQSLKALLDTLQKHPGKITVQVKMF